MTDVVALLSHHFLQFAQDQTVGKVPADTKQDHGVVELVALGNDELSGKTPRPMRRSQQAKSLQLN